MATKDQGLLKAVEVFLGRLLGKPEAEPLATISANQLQIVLRSIEDKYTLLQDENRRLQLKVDDQQRLITNLEKALKAHSVESSDSAGNEDMRRV